MKNVSFLYKNLPSPLTKRITWPQTTVFWLGNTATISSWSTALLPQWHPPWASPPLPPSSHPSEGKQSTAETKAYHWRDCRIGKTGARTAVSMRHSLLPTEGKHRELGSPSTEQLCAVGVSTTEPVGTPQHCCHTGAKTHQTPWAPQSCALLLLPEESHRTSAKGKQLDIKPLIWFH